MILKFLVALLHSNQRSRKIVWVGKLKTMQSYCCNYMSQWWVEFELTWLFTKRFRVFFILSAEINQILLQNSFIPILDPNFHVSSSTLSKNWVVNNLKSTQTQLIIVTDNCSNRFKRLKISREKIVCRLTKINV